jgi:hypothetical protein
VLESERSRYVLGVHYFYCTPSLHCSYCTAPTALLLLHCPYYTTPTTLLLLHCPYYTAPTTLLLLHCSYCTLLLLHYSYCTAPTILPLLHCSYCTAPTACSRWSLGVRRFLISQVSFYQVQCIARTCCYLTFVAAFVSSSVCLTCLACLSWKLRHLPCVSLSFP